MRDVVRQMVALSPFSYQQDLHRPLLNRPGGTTKKAIFLRSECMEALLAEGREPSIR